MSDKYTFTLRATIPVEPFRLKRDTFTSKRGGGRVREEYEIEVSSLNLFIFAEDGWDESFTTQAHRIKKDGTPYENSQHECVGWHELPDQAKAAARAAYASAVGNVVPTLNEGLA